MIVAPWEKNVNKRIDIHIHCAMERRWTGMGNPMDPESLYQADNAEILAHMDRQGITAGILMSGGESVPDGSMADNAVCIQLTNMYPARFHWMCGLDTENPDTIYERLKTYRAQGAVGVGEVMVNEWLDSPFLTALFQAAERLALPVLFHMSTRPGFSYGVCDRPRLPLLEESLRRFPGLIFIGHSQTFWMELSGDCPDDDRARMGFGQGPVIPGGRVVELMRAYPNLYADLSAFSGSCAILRDEAFGLAFCEEFYERLFFGTDTCNERTLFPLSGFLDSRHACGKLSTDAWEHIFHRNAERIFGV